MTDRLPTEILSSVFELAVDLRSHQSLRCTESEPYYQKLQSLRLVSRAWNEIIIVNPHLWSIVYSHRRPQNPSPAIDVLIERSKDVSVTLITPQVAIGGPRDGDTEAMTRLMTRVKALHFCPESADAARILVAPAPRLQYAEIDGRWLDDPRLGLSGLIAFETTQLKSLALHFTTIPGSGQTFDTLRSLSISRTWGTVVEVMNLLNRCPNLRSCKIDGFVHPYTAFDLTEATPTIAHPHLDGISLLSMTAVTTGTFLTHLRPTSWSFLHVQLDPYHDSPLLVPLASYFDAELSIQSVDISEARIKCVFDRKTALIESAYPDMGVPITFNSSLFRVFSSPLQGRRISVILDTGTREEWWTVAERLLDGLDGARFHVDRIVLVDLEVDGTSLEAFLRYLYTPRVLGSGTLYIQQSFFPFPRLRAFVFDTREVVDSALMQFVKARTAIPSSQSFDAATSGLSTICTRKGIPQGLRAEIEALGVEVCPFDTPAPGVQDAEPNHSFAMRISL